MLFRPVAPFITQYLPVVTTGVDQDQERKGESRTFRRRPLAELVIEVVAELVIEVGLRWIGIDRSGSRRVAGSMGEEVARRDVEAEGTARDDVGAVSAESCGPAGRQHQQAVTWREVIKRLLVGHASA